MLKFGKFTIGGLGQGRLVGALGSSIPLVGDAATVGYIKKHAGSLRGVGAKQGMKYVGGPVAVAAWSYSLYDVVKDAGPSAASQVDYSTRASHIYGLEIPSSSKSKKTSRGGRGSTKSSLSNRSRRSLSAPHRSRNRCRHVYRGKRCKLPRGHSGRHSYR